MPLKGYVQIGLNGRQYMAHRLAWLYATGSWPGGVIDHIDGQRANNALANLRDVTRSMNSQNRRGPSRPGKKEPLGVCFNKSCGKFQASISINKKLKHLGLFATPDQAYDAYLTAKRLHHEGNTL